MTKYHFIKVFTVLIKLAGALTLILLIASCKKKLSPNEARTYLRAMDSELIQLAQRIGSTRGLNELSHLSKLEGAPIPFVFKGTDSLINKTETFDFHQLMGIYTWDTIDNRLVKTALADSIIVLFPSKEQAGEIFQFTLSEWKEAPSAFGMKLPEKIKASISNRERTIWNLELDLQLREGLPVKLNASSNFQAFTIKSKLKTRLRKRNSTATFQLEVIESENKMVNFQVITEVNLNKNNAIGFGRKTIEARVFPVKMIFRASDGIHMLRPEHFVEDFNKSHNIRLLTTTYNRIGTTELRNIQGRDKLNPVIIYQDGSEETLEDLLLSARKILNFKIVNLN